MQKKTISFLKHFLFYSFYSPFDIAWRFFSRKNRYVILMYHQIIDSPITFNPSNLKIHLEWLKRQMVFLHRYCNVISLKEMVHKIRNFKEEGRLYFAVTFDDGYENNFKLALPLLKEYKIPATFFIVTDYAEQVEVVTWWDELEWSIAQSDVKVVDENNKEYNLSLMSDKYSFFFRMRNAILLNYERKESIIEDMKNKLKVRNRMSVARFAQWDELRRARSDIFDFGCHTTSHNLLLLKDMAHFKKDIMCSKDTIEQKLGLKVELFAYPYGGEAELREVKTVVLQEAGFCGAVTTLSGSNNSCSNPFFLKRVAICPFCAEGFAFRNHILFQDAIVFLNNLGIY